MATAGSVFRRMAVIFVTAVLWGGPIGSWGAEADWEFVDTNPAHSDFYYDKSSISRAPDGIVSVWTKVEYTEGGKADTLKILKNAKEYENIAQTQFLYDIDCKGAKSRLKQIVHYDGKGNRIKEFNLAGKTEWEEIPLYSRLESVTDEICPQP